jgi:hypothetical protein
MTNTELKILVQKENQLNPEKAIQFINKQKNAKLIIIHSSLNNDKKLENYIKHLNKNTKVPLIGLKVSGTYTKGEYYENAIVIGVLCGNMGVAVYHEKIDYEGIGQNAENIKQNIKENSRLLIYAGLYLTYGELVGKVLHQVHLKYPTLRSFGAFATPEPAVLTNRGLFRGEIVYAVIDDIEYEFSLESGAEFKKDSEEYTVTKADDYRIYEVDGESSIKVYSGITKTRPWFINMYMKQFIKPAPHKVLSLMARTNEKLYEAVKRITIDLLGIKTSTGIVEVFPILRVDEDKGSLLTFSNISEGTKLRWATFTEKTMIGSYEKIKQKLKHTKAIIGHACVYRTMTYGFKHDEVSRKLKQKTPYLISYTFGEIDVLPYERGEDSITHAGVVSAAGIW